MDDNAEQVGAVEEEIVDPVEQDVKPEETSVGEQKDAPAEEPKPEKTFTQSDMDRLIEKRLGRERAKFERETEQLRQIALQRGEQKPEQQTNHPAAEQEPKLEDFQDYESYLKAAAKHEARQELQQQLTQHNQRLEQENAQAAQRKSAESWNQKVSSATAEMPDFEDVISSSTVPMPPHVEAMVKQSEHGPKLAYYLATHPEEAMQIASQHPLDAIRSLVRIEDKVSVAPVVKKATDAAAPITPVGAKAKSEKAPEDMTFDEFTRYRKKIIANRR